MDWRLAVVLLLCLFKTVDRVDGSCKLSLKQDFGTPAPVFLRNGAFLAPAAGGEVLLRRAETLQVACPGRNKFVVLTNHSTLVDVVDLKCVSNTTFRAKQPAWVGLLREARCTEPPWFSAEQTGARCPGGHHIYRVGYSVRGVFHQLYEACFDTASLRTTYVKHELSPYSIHAQVSGRPQFIEGDLFPKVPVGKAYKVKQQRERLSQLLGPDLADRYISKNQFLNRGHLAAKADFPLAAQQRASFHYINTAPQWSRGNSGDWAALEEAIRRRLKSYDASVTVYTGGHGVSWLEDRAGAPQSLFLHTDENNNDVLPVPLYFFKVVHDPRKRTGTAFISLNSPYYNQSTIDKLSFCDDVCAGDARFSWLRWRANDATHSFCCEYGDFARVIDSLPKIDVKGLFY